MEHLPKYKSLTDFAIPELIAEQLDAFDLAGIHSERVMEFDAKQARSKLQTKEGQAVIAADFGGDKGISQLFIVQNGQLIPDNRYHDYIQGNDGDGYLESLEKTAAFATKHNLPVGLSWGAPLNGTKPLYHDKIKHFLTKLSKKYNGDLAAIFSTLQICLKDGPAGLLGSLIEDEPAQSAESVLFAINGGGLGIAALANGIIYATEAGHVKAAPALNTYHQTTPCRVFGAHYVCLENIGANKVGIESQWQIVTGNNLSAREIEARYNQGDELAAKLYDHSALVDTHVILGSAKAFNIDLVNPSSLIIGHGGAFKFPHYGDRIQQILGQALRTTPKLIMSKDYGNSTSNACLDGAAYGALLA